MLRSVALQHAPDENGALRDRTARHLDQGMAQRAVGGGLGDEFTAEAVGIGAALGVVLEDLQSGRSAAWVSPKREHATGLAGAPGDRLRSSSPASPVP